MKSRKRTDPLMKRLQWVLVAVVGVYAVLLVAYFGSFGKQGCCSTEAWGQFGDFIGGTANPLLGLVSILLLYATLREQRALLTETQRRGALEEIQRLAGAASHRLGQVLATRIDDHDSDVFSFVNKHSSSAGRSFFVDGATLEDLLDVGRAALRDGKLGFDDALVASSAPGFSDLRIALLRLDAVLEVFELEGGAGAVLRAYGLTFASAALFCRAMDEAGMFSPKVGAYGPNPLARLRLDEAYAELQPGVAAVQADLERQIERSAKRHQKGLAGEGGESRS